MHISQCNTSIQHLVPDIKALTQHYEEQAAAYYSTAISQLLVIEPNPPYSPAF